MSVSENVKRLRKKRGWSQVRLAMEAHVSQQSISFIERGRNEPSAEMIRALSKAFGVSASEIIDNISDNNAAETGMEKQLMEIFRQLNTAGRQFLIQQAETVLAQPAFRQENNIQSVI